jgi:methylmalonyl-CoA mutase cobalamin-binding subunit
VDDLSKAPAEVPRGEGAVPSPAAADAPQPWVSLVARNRAAKDRLSRLALALDQTVIPRVAESHREHHRETLRDAPAAALPDDAPREGPAVRPSEVETLLAHVRAHQHAEASALILRLRLRGLSVDRVCLDVLGPVASRLGELWEEDRCDFATVTLAMGTVQHLLRDLGTAFLPAVADLGQEERVVLFAQAPTEQHSFGLSVLADFFRRAGWDVHGGVGGAVPDPAAAVRRAHFDVLGLSVGSEAHLPWARRCIADARRGSLNRELRVLVGGPLFVGAGVAPSLLDADGFAGDAPAALRLAEQLVAPPSARRAEH